MTPHDEYKFQATLRFLKSEITELWENVKKAAKHTDNPQQFRAISKKTLEEITRQLK